jgi:hypothetical protein
MGRGIIQPSAVGNQLYLRTQRLGLGISSGNGRCLDCDPSLCGSNNIVANPARFFALQRSDSIDKWSGHISLREGGNIQEELQ